MKKIVACVGCVLGNWEIDPPECRNPEIPNAKKTAEIFAVVDLGEKYPSRMK